MIGKVGPGNKTNNTNSPGTTDSKRGKPSRGQGGGGREINLPQARRVRKIGGLERRRVRRIRRKRIGMKKSSEDQKKGGVAWVEIYTQTRWVGGLQKRINLESPIQVAND